MLSTLIPFSPYLFPLSFSLLLPTMSYMISPFPFLSADLSMFVGEIEAFKFFDLKLVVLSIYQGAK